MDFNSTLSLLVEANVKFVINSTPKTPIKKDEFLTKDNEWVSNLQKALKFNSISDALSYGKNVFGDRLVNLKKSNGEYWTADLKDTKGNVVVRGVQFLTTEHWDHKNFYDHDFED